MYGNTSLTTAQLEALTNCVPERATTNEVLCAEVAGLRSALKSAQQALELALPAAKRCVEEMPGLENALDVLEIELAIAKAEQALK